MNFSSAPPWLDRSAYPFASHFFETEAGRLHYVDEGAGPPVLMLHGNPTWSFLYRHVIRHLAPQYRCVAPDYLGFGLSDKPAAWSYHPADHARIIETFVEHLDLRDLTLVVQDWGGPIGLHYAVHHPERVRRLVIMNTWMWPVDDILRFRLFSSVLGSAMGRLLIQRFGLFERILMPLAFGLRGTLSTDAYRHYCAPLDRADRRKGAWVFSSEVAGAADWLGTLWARRDRLANRPTLLIWGLRDPAFRETELRQWEQLLTSAHTKRLPKVGHYVQEELGSDLGSMVASFLQET